MKNSQGSQSGGAVRGLVIAICIAALGVLGYQLAFESGLSDRDVTRFGGSIGGMILVMGAVVLGVLALFMPWFAYVAAREATAARQAADRIEALLMEQRRVEGGKAWQETATAADDEVPTIYPPKAMRGPRRLS